MVKKIVDLPNCKLSVSAEHSLDHVIGYGSRINNKRSYLFISKVLGKHIPVTPKKLISSHKKLSKLINPVIYNDTILVIGLAETATGLGWGVFNQLKVKSKLYIHTSRVQLKHPLFVEFEEPHSHAVEQYLYYPKSKKFNPRKINHIIIVDDELTTGNTIKNLITKLSERLLNTKFSVLTLVNWKNYKKDFKIYALYEGFFSVKEKSTSVKKDHLTVSPQKKHSFRNELGNNFGRLGSTSFPSLPKRVITMLKSFKRKKILLLGTGEFMHYPLSASSFIHENNSVKIQSTTRSPVQVVGDIHSKLIFKDNYYPNICNYLYNVIDKKYDIVIIFYEAKSPFDHLLIDQLSEKFDTVIPVYL